MPKGYLSLVLHAHLPFVRHPETEDALEERWLFEAMTECYLPLIDVMRRWTTDGMAWRMTISVSPTLGAMLKDGLLMDRYALHLQGLIKLADTECQRTEESSPEHHVVKFYQERLRRIFALWQSYDGDLIRALRELQDCGHLEIITTSATHAFLPLVQTEQAIRAQIATAVSMHYTLFGRKPVGMWLPECAYRPGVEKVLSEYGIQYFFVDTEGIMNASPRPVFGAYAPVVTDDGVAAFGRDRESAKLVWSSKEGYPGDYDYREFYRDIGYDRPLEQIGSWLPEGHIRIDTGLKYYRITGDVFEKDFYRPDWAKEKAAQNAQHFLERLQKQVEQLQAEMGRKPVVTSMYDAELFGHWWFEGPQFIDFLFRKICYDQDTVLLIKPSEYLELYPDFQTCRLRMSSWGRDGFADVWLNGSNDWIYRALHQAERDMITLANQFSDSGGDAGRILQQAARELLLAESSDWPFIMENQTTVQYAIRRVKAHVNRFFQLKEMLLKAKYDMPLLEEIENQDNLFEHIDCSIYRTHEAQATIARGSTDGWTRKVLMLSSEYPPHIVGGLARHVSQIAESLVEQGFEVHVVTPEVPGEPYDDVQNGVYIHRCHVLAPQSNVFLDAVFQMNIAMVRRVQSLRQEGLRFDLIHAHDWLVYNAAKTLKSLSQCPLVSTIHATEHGRNNGIHTDLQRTIHKQDAALMNESEEIIVCSDYMSNEVQRVFSVAPHKVHVIPNGIDVRTLGTLTRWSSTHSDARIESQRSTCHQVLFIGRIVREKGIHVLIQAIPKILEVHLNTVFYVVGAGPMLDSLKQDAAHLPVHFPGFVSDETRNQLLASASVCVFPSLYEPFGIVTLEAMAAGVPVVVSDTGGLSEIVRHERNGLTCFPGNSNSLADQVNRILSDLEFSNQLRGCALDDVNEHYLWPKIAKRTGEVYERTLKVTPSRREENAG